MNKPQLILIGVVCLCVLAIVLAAGLMFYGYFAQQTKTIPPGAKFATEVHRIAGPTMTALALSATPTSVPATNTPTLVPTLTPTPKPTELPRTYTVKRGDTLWDIGILYGVPYAVIAHANGITTPELIFAGQEITIPDASYAPPAPKNDTKIILVTLSTQRLYAYESGKLVGSFLVSTGLNDTPTPIGEYKVQQKLDIASMSGPGYNIPDVPWTMYFYDSYAIHGAYWHNRFGMQMSRGCINMSVSDAEWLYKWAEVGTLVVVTK